MRKNVDYPENFPSTKKFFTGQELAHTRSENNEKDIFAKNSFIEV